MSNQKRSLALAEYVSNGPHARVQDSLASGLAVSVSILIPHSSNELVAQTSQAKV